MNIDYSEIITKANARKDALQALDVVLTHAEGQAAELFKALDYFIGLKPFVEAIDAEGVAMIGSIPARATDIARKCGSLRLYLTNDSDNSYSGVGRLLHYVRTLGTNT